MSTLDEKTLHDLRPQLVRYLARLVGEAGADDVAQVTLAKAAAGAETFRGETSVRAWVFRIATHAALDWLRAERRTPLEQPPRGEPADPDDDRDELGAIDANQERALLREEMSACVQEHLARLPESYRLVLALSETQELLDREIADVLGCSTGAAKIRLHRARSALKEELERACSFYRDERDVLCCDRKAPDVLLPGRRR
jgi:RNA polymerase sigma-70 factor (ECF subfamily)